jgi:hypothetical protein
MNIHLRCWIGVCCFLAIGVTEAAEQVVLDSNSAKYQAGKTLDSATVISLAGMEFVTLAMEDGTLRRIDGPFMGVAADANGSPPRESNVRRAIAALFGAGPAERGNLGGVRGAPDDRAAAPDTRPNAWLIQAEQTGDQCVVRDAPVRLWREQASAQAKAEVTDVVSRRAATAEWPAEQPSADWPLESPPVDGRIYLVRPSNSLRSVAIRVHALAPDLLDKGLGTVAWLAARGCVAQARLLLQRDNTVAVER